MKSINSSSAIVIDGLIETYAYSQTTYYDKDDWYWYNGEPIEEDVHAPIYRSPNEWPDQYLWIRSSHRNSHFQSLPFLTRISPLDTLMGFMCQRIENKLLNTTTTSTTEKPKTTIEIGYYAVNSTTVKTYYFYPGPTCAGGFGGPKCFEECKAQGKETLELADVNEVNYFFFRVQNNPNIGLVSMETGGFYGVPEILLWSWSTRKYIDYEIVYGFLRVWSGGEGGTQLELRVTKTVTGTSFSQDRASGFICQKNLVLG